MLTTSILVHYTCFIAYNSSSLYGLTVLHNALTWSELSYCLVIWNNLTYKDSTGLQNTKESL